VVPASGIARSRIDQSHEVRERKLTACVRLCMGRTAGDAADAHPRQEIHEMNSAPLLRTGACWMPLVLLLATAAE
jgi:hypothetical protein